MLMRPFHVMCEKSRTTERFISLIGEAVPLRQMLPRANGARKETLMLMSGLICDETAHLYTFSRFLSSVQVFMSMLNVMRSA